MTPPRCTAKALAGASNCRGNAMALYFWTVLGGLVGTALMDLWEKLLERAGITTRGG